MGGRPRQPPARLDRRKPKKNPRAKITVVCEGKITEPQYLNELARYYGCLISLDLVIRGAAGVPLSILRKARELIRYPEEEFGQNDQVWAVFDCDDHPEVARVIREAGEAGVSIGYSNPCFELWLVLHYRDFDAPARRDQIQRALRSLMPSYNPRGSKEISFAEICDGVELAERRAEQMDKRRAQERNSRGNPSSTVYELTREIRKHGK